MHAVRVLARGLGAGGRRHLLARRPAGDRRRSCGCRYPLARLLDQLAVSARWRGRSSSSGTTWMGVLFLALRRPARARRRHARRLPAPAGSAPTLRGWALAAAAVLAAVALVQGLRPPVVVDYEVQLAGLPRRARRHRAGRALRPAPRHAHRRALDGAAGGARRRDEARPDRGGRRSHRRQRRPGRAARAGPPRLRAPLGVWAVTGNHEFYAGLDRSVKLFEEAGFHVLRDRWAEVAPGLVLAGVDDLTARRQFGLDGAPVESALAGRPAGATVLLSHTPWQADKAAGARRRPDALGPHPRRPDLAVRLPRPARLPAARRPLRGRRR